MIRVTNIQRNGYIVLVDLRKIDLYDVTICYQDALGTDELLYTFRDDELSAQSIQETLKTYIQERNMKIERIEKINRELL